MKIDGELAIVAGGASGLGQAVVRHLATQGAKVVILDRDEDEASALAKAVDGFSYKVDISSDSEVEAAFADIAALHGRARIAVNTAGILRAGRLLTKSGPHDARVFEDVMKINLFGTFYFLRHAAAMMASLDAGYRGERGVVVNTASIAAFDGQKGQLAYAASKAGVVGITLPAARDLGSLGIRVVAVAPGLFHTPILTPAKDHLSSMEDEYVFPRAMGEPADFASLVEQVIRNVMLNGEVIRLDGALRVPQG